MLISGEWGIYGIISSMDAVHPIRGKSPGSARLRVLLASIAALAAISVAQLADLATFLNMVSIGGLDAEANPIVAYLGASLGLGALVALKVGLIGFAAMVFAVLARIREGLAASVLTFATLAGLIGAVSNVLAVS